MIRNNSVKKITLLAICSTLILVGKVSFLFIPNIEVVTFFLIIFTISFKLKEALLISTVFTIVEILTWGISEQAYIWTLIVIVTFLFKKLFKKNFTLWSLYSGFFGLFFGFLSAIPFIFIANFNYAVGYFISGLPFDAIHMLGNYGFMLLLGELIYNKLQILLNDYYNDGGNNENLY